MPYFSPKQRLTNFVRLGPWRRLFVWPRHWGLRESDVFMSGYHKCGTTWLVFMLSELLWKLGDEQKILDHRFVPKVGRHRDCNYYLPTGGRLMRTHERYRSEFRRAICIVRDPRDAAVSMYYHLQRTMDLKGSFSDFLPMFLFSPPVSGGTWNSYMNGWLDAPIWDRGQGLLVRYEDMQADTARELRRAARFVGLDPTDEEIARGVECGRFDVMQKREKTTQGVIHRESGTRINAIRKGISGDWRNHFSREDEQKLIDAFGPTMQRLGYTQDDDRAVRDTTAGQPVVTPDQS